MDIYLAGTYSRRYVVEEALKSDLYLAGAITGGNISKQVKSRIFEGEKMDLYLAGDYPWKKKGIYDETIKNNGLFVLESFFYVDEFTLKYIPYFKKFLLDSGAFTFMSSKKDRNINWDRYVEQYADFINRNKVELFFELDIDSILGIKEVERLRYKLERLTSKQCIPVWHKSRGKDYYLRMCDEYGYVALGGIVSREFSIKEHRYFPWFIENAHSRGAKVHGLGYTNLNGIRKYKFDSVDSTSWTSGNRFGCCYIFTGKTLIKKQRSKNERMIDTKRLALHNFNEWVKFQKYAEKHL